MRRLLPAMFVLATTLSACTAVDALRVRGGPAMALAPADVDQVRIDLIFVEGTSRVIDQFQSYRGEDPSLVELQEGASRRAPFIESDFSLTFESELRHELKRCATGTRPLHAVVLIDEFRMDERLRSLIDAKGFDTVSGVVEFVDPATDTVVGRYRIRAGTNSGGLLSRIVGDRADNAAEEFGRALCMEAFGRNPRPPRILNSTRG